MARPRKHDGVVYQRNDSSIWWMRYRDKNGRRCLESTNTSDWEEAQRQLGERLQSRDNNTLEFIRKGKQITFNELADFFLENYSKPPIRASKTHVANENALKTLRPAFGNRRLADIDPTQIELHLRERLQQKRHARRKSGVVAISTLKPTTVHQEFRVMRRILNVALKKKLIPANPCAAVEFPVILRSFFRPHYVTSTEQAKIEQHAPAYLRNVIRIIAETGLRIYKELACMKKDQVDLANKVVFIADSKTPTGVCEVPLTDIAIEAFRNQLELAGPGPWLFPSSHKPTEHQTDFKKTWRRTLNRAGVPYFVFPALRPALNIRHEAECRRCRG